MSKQKGVLVFMGQTTKVPAKLNFVHVKPEGGTEDKSFDNLGQAEAFAAERGIELQKIQPFTPESFNSVFGSVS